MDMNVNYLPIIGKTLFFVNIANKIQNMDKRIKGFKYKENTYVHGISGGRRSTGKDGKRHHLR